jgi:excisionase family DNA binding protein
VKPVHQTKATAHEIVLRDLKGRRLPDLATPAQLAEALQVTSHTILNWERSGKIRAAFRLGRVVRFNPMAVAEALGIKAS